MFGTSLICENESLLQEQNIMLDCCVTVSEKRLTLLNLKILLRASLFLVPILVPHREKDIFHQDTWAVCGATAVFISLWTQDTTTKRFLRHCTLWGSNLCYKWSKNQIFCLEGCVKGILWIPHGVITGIIFSSGSSCFHFDTVSAKLYSTWNLWIHYLNVYFSSFSTRTEKVW